MGAALGAFGAGFFGGLNKQHEQNYDDQKQFNQQYEARVQSGIEAYNAAMKQGAVDADNVTALAGMIPGNAAPETKIKAAKFYYRTQDPKTLTPEFMGRVQVNEDGSTGSPQPTQGAVNNTTPSQPTSAQPSSPMPAMMTPNQPSAPSQATQPQMAASGSQLPLGHGSAPPPPGHMPMVPTPDQHAQMTAQQPQQGQPTQGAPPPSMSLQQAPTGVASPGIKGMLSHLMTGQPLTGQREGLAANRSAALRGITPEQAQGYANFQSNQPGFRVEGGISTRQQLPPDKIQGLIQNTTPDANTGKIASDIMNGDFSSAFANTQNKTDLLVSQAQGRGSEAASIHAAAAQHNAFVTKLPALISSITTDPDTARRMTELFYNASLATLGGNTLGTVPPIKDAGVPSAGTSLPTRGAPNAATKPALPQGVPPGSQPGTGTNAGKWRTPDGKIISPGK